jgi:hydroxyacylglutathione hydrolase
MADIKWNINQEGVPEITPEQAMALISEAEFIDVRRADEFTGELGHIEGSELITLETEFATKVRDFDKNKTYIFVCRSGIRSSRATFMAQSLGIKSSFNMAGGMIRWNAENLPVKK